MGRLARDPHAFANRGGATKIVAAVIADLSYRDRTTGQRDRDAVPRVVVRLSSLRRPTSRASSTRPARTEPMTPSADAEGVISFVWSLLAGASPASHDRSVTGETAVYVHVFTLVADGLP